MVQGEKRDRNSSRSNPPTPDRQDIQRRKLDGSNDTNIKDKVQALTKEIKEKANIVLLSSLGGPVTAEIQRQRRHIR